jgi:hypothetical protein
MDTLLIPFREMGKVAVRQLLRKIENPTEVLPSRVLPLTLALGETCAQRHLIPDFVQIPPEELCYEPNSLPA